MLSAGSQRRRYIMDPFTERPLSVLYCSHLGLVTCTRKSKGGYCMTNPDGEYVNADIPEKE